jgi:hypothetical protein
VKRSLPPKLAAVMTRLARRAGPAGLPPSHLATLPYLVDVVAMRVLGRPITEGTHVCISEEERLSLDRKTEP